MHHPIFAAYESFQIFTLMHPVLYVLALFAFSFLWFYFPTKLMYPKLGFAWELFVAMPCGVAGFGGLLTCIVAGDPVMFAIGLAYGLFILVWWTGHMNRWTQRKAQR